MKPKTKHLAPLTREFRRIYCFGFSLVVFLLSLLSVHAGVKSSADFLKIPIGAEAAAMGQAYTAMSAGVNALNWNPAGLVRQPDFLATPSYGLSFSHQDHFLDSSLDHLGLSLPASKNHWAAGFSIVRLSYGSQEKRGDDRETTGSFDSYDMSVGAALARDFGAFQLGTQLKMIRMDLAGYEASGVAADLGLTSQIPNSRFSLGLAARNLGPRMKFVDESFQLPLTLSIGTMFHVTGPLSLSVDLQSRPYQDQMGLSIGSQFLASKNVALRAGYLARVAESIENNQRSETNRGNLGGVAGLAGGLGIRFNQFSIDYAITPFGELGNSQSLTLATWFGGAATKPAIETVPAAPAPAKDDDRDILILPKDDHSNWDHLGQ